MLICANFAFKLKISIINVHYLNVILHCYKFKCNRVNLYRLFHHFFIDEFSLFSNDYFIKRNILYIARKVGIFMINIALYGHNEKFLGELRDRLTASLSAFGQEFIKIQHLSHFQTSLFTDSIDFYIIDISSESEKGLQFASDIKSVSITEIIFISSDPKYAITAFELDAIGFYMIPIDVDSLSRKLLSHLSKPQENDKNPVFFKTITGVTIIPSQRITHIEYSNHKMNIFLDTGETFQTTTMRQSFTVATENILRFSCFVRTHASFIVNLSHLSALKSSEITLNGNITVPISHAKYPAVKKHIMDFFDTHVHRNID